MTVRHLRIFAAVVDCGTMHAAAQKLYLSQPTITQAIKELEEHYGCLLFERYGRRLMITPAGQELLGHARELLSVYERMERSMKQNAGQKLLRIGATVVLAEQLLVPMVQAFEAQNPEIRVEVLVDNSSVLESRLLSGELDAALLDSAGRSSEVQLRPFLREKLVVAAAPFHPLAQCTAPDQVVLHQPAHGGAGGAGWHGDLGSFTGADAGGAGSRYPAGDPGGGLCRSSGDFGCCAPGPERLRTAGTVPGFLPGTIRPALSISFYQNKADKHRNPGSVRGFLYVVTKLKICRKIHQKSIAFRL